jgi:hypothetical protein
MPYGCNDNIKEVGNVSSPGCSEIQELNVTMVIKEFNIQMLKSPLIQERYKILLMIYFLIYRNLLEFIIFLFSLPVDYLKDLRDFGLDKGDVDPFSPKYRLSSIICDVASFRRFKPVRPEPLHGNNRKCLHIPFANKRIDAIDISNILNRKEVVKEIPSYIKNQSFPIVSYSYTNSIGLKIFTYKETLQNINIEEYLKNPLTCDCSHSPFQCNPFGHVITGDLNIIQHESLQKVISHGPKFREPQHINWKHNFKIIMDAVENYARRWIKREGDQDPE